ncbi:MAG: hypothetical protein ACLGI2_04880 [Acidimicrobiia bacterium]
MKATRTRIARLAVATAAVVISIGPGVPADAAPVGENYPGGESTFRRECGMAGGTFKRDPATGTIFCRFRSGTVVICDRGARNCKTYNPLTYQPSGSAVDPGPVVAYR